VIHQCDCKSEISHYCVHGERPLGRGLLAGLDLIAEIPGQLSRAFVLLLLLGRGDPLLLSARLAQARRELIDLIGQRTVEHDAPFETIRGLT
jgi:hypothetical protein